MYSNVKRGGGGGSSLTPWAKARLDEAVAALGLTDYGYSFDPNDSPGLAGWTPSAVNGSTLNPTTFQTGGVSARQTSATANSQYNEYQGFAVIQPTIANVRTRKWYFAYEMAITTVGTPAECVAGEGLFNQANNNSIIPGFHGPLNGTNFSVQFHGNFTGSSLDLGVARNASMNTFACWGDGANGLSAKMTGGNVVSTTLTASAPSDPCRRARVHKNGATGGNVIVERRAWIIVWSNI